MVVFANRVWSAIRRNPVRAATLSGSLLALLPITLAVGWVWFGWGYVAKNQDLLDSLPVPPGTLRISVESSSYSSDELILIPPDGWVTRTTYKAHPQASKADIVDFYVSELSPEWRSCENYVNTVDLSTGKKGGLLTGVTFKKGVDFVSVDILNMTTVARTFDVAVDHNRVGDFCN